MIFSSFGALCDVRMNLPSHDVIRAKGISEYDGLVMVGHEEEL